MDMEPQWFAFKWKISKIILLILCIASASLGKSRLYSHRDDGRPFDYETPNYSYESTMHKYPRRRLPPERPLIVDISRVDWKKEPLNISGPGPLPQRRQGQVPTPSPTSPTPPPVTPPPSPGGGGATPPPIQQPSQPPIQFPTFRPPTQPSQPDAPQPPVVNPPGGGGGTTVVDGGGATPGGVGGGLLGLGGLGGALTLFSGLRITEWLPMLVLMVIGPIIYGVIGLLLTKLTIAHAKRTELIEKLDEAEEILDSIHSFTDHHKKHAHKNKHKHHSFLSSFGEDDLDVLSSLFGGKSDLHLHHKKKNKYKYSYDRDEVLSASAAESFPWYSTLFSALISSIVKTIELYSKTTQQVQAGQGENTLSTRKNLNSDNQIFSAEEISLADLL